MTTAAPAPRPALTLLAFGDSITETGRFDDPESIGTGYVRMLRDDLAERLGDEAVEVVNRGVSSDRVHHLRERFDRDCAAVRPDIVVLYIGTNNTFGRRSGVKPTPMLEFEEDYRALVDSIDALDTRPAVVILTPFMPPPVGDEPPFEVDLYTKAALIHRIADEHGHPSVDLREAFMEVLDDGADPAALFPDGVHPSAEGHRIIADAALPPLLHVIDERIGR